MKNITMDHLITFLSTNIKKPKIGATVEIWEMCGMGMTIRNKEIGKVVGFEKKEVYGSRNKKDPFVKVEVDGEQRDIILYDLHESVEGPWVYAS